MIPRLLRGRPRLRRLLKRLATRTLNAVDRVEPPTAHVPPGDELAQPSEPPPAEPQPAGSSAPSEPLEPVEPPSLQPIDFARELYPAALAVERRQVRAALFARLTSSDVEEVERRLAEHSELEHHYRTSPLDTRDFLVLAYGVWLGVPAVLEKTGLLPEQPPEEVHAMARGPLAAAGGLYEADLVIDALASAGVDAAAIRAGLDFGCSSGRVVRVLAAVYPDASWYACDPNPQAIEWATARLEGVEFFVNDQTPPLELADGSLDLAYAISIWSHFAPELGLRWFEEMHRLIRPGGHLVCTTHGPCSVAFYAVNELRTPQQSDEIKHALYRKGWWYMAEFGEEGDWGVINPEWGTAFVSPEWLLAQLCPGWRVLEFAPGRNQGNQDVYVLERV
jgi:SAM-dependent methyltransferase